MDAPEDLHYYVPTSVFRAGTVAGADTGWRTRCRAKHPRSLSTVNINAAQPDGTTALHWAVHHQALTKQEAL